MIYICCVGFASLDVVCDELNDCEKIPHFGHIRPRPLTPQKKKFYFKTYYLRPIQYFSILINTLYFILNGF